MKGEDGGVSVLALAGVKVEIEIAEKSVRVGVADGIHGDVLVPNRRVRDQRELEIQQLLVDRQQP